MRPGGPLSAFPNLEHLYFVESKLKRIPELTSLPNLHVLECGGNRIREIENIEVIPNLQELWLGKNKIEIIKVYLLHLYHFLFTKSLNLEYQYPIP